MPHLPSALLGCLLMLCTLATATHAGEDLREVVTLPPDIKQSFLSEMRAHMGNLDDILAAVAEGDFGTAADIADISMDFGHRMWEAMAARGMSPEEILAMKQAMRGGGGHGGQGSGRGGGMGRHMPEGFRAIGQGFHAAAAAFAETVRAIGPDPTAADYQTALAELGQITAHCRACHDAYRIE